MRGGRRGVSWRRTTAAAATTAGEYGERCWIRGRSKVKGGGEGRSGEEGWRPVLEKEGWRR